MIDHGDSKSENMLTPKIISKDYPKFSIFLRL